MISYLSKKLSSFFIENNIIQAEDRKVYDYSIEILLSTMMNFVAVAILAILFGRIPETVCFLIGFMPLRSVAGGYHARNHLRCLAILMTAYFIFIITLSVTPEWLTVIIISVSTICSVLFIFLLAPVEDKNKPLSEDEKKIFKKKSRMTILCYSLAVAVIQLVPVLRVFALSIVIGNLTVSLSLLASLIRNKISVMLAERVKQIK